MLEICERATDCSRRRVVDVVGRRRCRRVVRVVIRVVRKVVCGEHVFVEEVVKGRTVSIARHIRLGHVVQIASSNVL